MTAPIMSPKEVSEMRVWRMSQARQQVFAAQKALLDLLDIWPEEARGLDLDHVRGLWNRIEEGVRK